MASLTPIKKWMRVASVTEQNKMADLAGTSRAMLYQYAGGFRSTSAERAASIEVASEVLASETKGKLPVLYRTDLSKACAQCPFARKCLGAASEFDLN